jgi:hypothetical protein
MKEKVENLNQQLVALATQFMAKKDDPRWYLKGVHAKPNKTGGVNIIATNGHRLVVYFDPDGYLDEPVLICPDSTFIREGKKPEVLNRCLVIREEKDIFLQMASGYTSNSDIKNLKGVYPDVSNMFDAFIDWTEGKGSMAPAFAIDGFYLKDLDAMVPKTIEHGKVSKPGRANFDVIPGGPEKANAFYNRTHEILILIMPVKSKKVGKRPEWLTSFLGLEPEKSDDEKYNFIKQIEPGQLEEVGTG